MARTAVGVLVLTASLGSATAPAQQQTSLLTDPRGQHLQDYLSIAPKYLDGHITEAAAAVAKYDRERLQSLFEYVAQLRALNRGHERRLIRPLTAMALLHFEMARAAEEKDPLKGHLSTAHAWVDVLHRVPGATHLLRRIDLAIAYHLHSHWALYGLRTHIERSGRLYPDDAEFLLARGMLWESYASAKISEPRPRNLPSASAGLVRAEREYRATLAIDSSLAEARLRLGRVLFRRGKHEEAAAELLHAHKDERLRYLAALFLGAVHEDAQRYTDARLAYQDATQVCSTCPVARLALSHAVAASGDRAAASEHIHRAVTWQLPDDQADPWWNYDFGLGWRVDTFVAAFRTELRQ